MTYTLTLTAAQVRVIRDACEVYGRLGLGQIDCALETLPVAEPRDWSRWHHAHRTIAAILAPHMGLAPNAFLGVGHPRVDEDAHIAWDVRDVLRHHLAWERARSEGMTNPDGSRKWPDMMAVSYDRPMHHSREPLPKIEGASE